MSKSILVVHNFYQITGGEDTVVNNEIEMLKKNGNKVVTYFRSNKEIKKMGIMKKMLLPFKSFFSFRTIKEINKIIDRENIEIVHIHNTFPLITPSVYWIASKKVKVFQTLHNYRFICAGAMLYRDGSICEKCIEKTAFWGIKKKCYKNSYLKTINLILINKFNKLIGSFEKVNRYICLTEFNKEKIGNFIDENRIVVKENFEKSIFYSEEMNSRSGFVYLGRLEKAKGVNLLVESWVDYKEDLIIIGAGEEEEKIKTFIKINNLDNIKLLGNLDKSLAMKYVEKAKALIFPSQCYETFGLVIIEALKRGTPVIANKLGSIPELVKGEECGVVDKINDVNTMQKAINKFMELDKRKKYDNNKIYKKYLNYYTIEKNYEMINNIYESWECENEKDMHNN